METKAALSGTSCVVMNHTECLENLRGTIVHLNGDGEMNFLAMLTEQIAGSLI
jgi:hypothetical protein